MKRVWPLLAACLAGFCSCGGPPPSPPPAVDAPTAVPEAVPANEARERIVRLRITTLEGTPLANMRAVATREANAFGAPVATAAPSGADGRTRLRIPADEYLYVRPWDSSLLFFTNSLLEFPPGDAGEVEEQQVFMARGAQLSLQVLRPDGAPASMAPLRLMFSHPQRGPWWPERATSDAEGRVVLPSVPPGAFALEIDAGASGAAHLSRISLSPGGVLDLGPVPLEPRGAS
jgi:hypothetical protein